MPPHFLTDQLTLFQPWRSHFPHPVLCALPDFQTLRRPCIKNYQNIQNQLIASIQRLNHRSIQSIQSVKENIFKVFYFNSNLPKHVLNHYPELYSPKEKMLRIVFGTFLGRLEKYEKLSEIKPPLKRAVIT